MAMKTLISLFFATMGNPIYPNPDVTIFSVFLYSITLILIIIFVYSLLSKKKSYMQQKRRNR